MSAIVQQSLSASIVDLGGRSRVLREFFPLTDTGESGWMHVAMEGTWEGHPSGPFELTREAFAAIVERFEAQANPMVVDYEHQSVNASLNGAAPAAGWIQQLELRDGDGGAELWAFVEWTAEAADHIKGGAYRFCSPVIDFDSVDRESGEEVGVELFNVALTNNPFLDGQTPIALSLVGASMDIKAAATKARDAAQRKLNAVEALQRAAGKLSEDASADDVINAVFAELDGEETREAIKEVLAEAGVTSPEPAEEAAAAATLVDGVPGEDEEEEEEEVAAADEPGAETPSPDATAFLEALASKAGLDTAAALAFLNDNLDAVADLIGATADEDGTPAEGAPMSDANADAVELRMDALEAENRKLTKQVTTLNADKKQREDDAEEQRKRDAEALVDQKIAEGYILDAKRDTALRLALSDRPAFDEIYDTKVVPIDDSQAGSGDGDGDGEAPLSLNDVTDESTRRLAEIYHKLGRFGGQQACIAKAQADIAQRSN